MSNNPGIAGLRVLCQPGAGKSCGACCGLYNYVDSSRSSLILRLRARTGRFRRMVRSRKDLQEYSRATIDEEDFQKRYEEIYCCEYLGFLDKEERKAGCLLHPQQNAGVDLRDVSFYGRELCAGHLCPSHYFIPDAQAEILIQIIDDWYLYGLCITDIDLVRTYFRLLADKTGEEIKAAAFANDDLRQVARRYFGWKIAWPFRSPDTNRLGKYYFDGSQYMISRIDYESFGRPVSPFNSIFLSLSSVFGSAREIDLAEGLILSNLEEFISIYAELA